MKASSVMVCPVVHLPTVLSDADRDVLRKVLLDGIRGIDSIHDKRWRRMVGGLINSEPGEVTEFMNPRRRSLPFHKRWMAIERAIFENQERYQTLKAFRRWLKTGADLGDYAVVSGKSVYVPASASFDDTSDDEMREFVKAAEDFLHTSRAQRRLWPHLNAAARQEMVDTLLRDPKENER